MKDEVMDWARLKGGLLPMEVQSILQSMRGITSTTASIVAAKYSFALTKAQQEGKLQLPSPLASGIPTPQLQPPLWGFTPSFQQSIPQSFSQTPFQQPTPISQTQPQSYTPPSYQPQPSWYPPSQPDVRNIIREEIRAIEERRPKEVETYVDIEEPVRDADGKVIIGPDDRPIMKRMRVPANQASQFAAPREDVEMKVLEKLAKYKELFGPKEELTTEKIREIIRQETPTPPPKEEKTITPEDVQRAASEAASAAVKNFIEAHEKEDREEARFRRLEETIRSTASAKAVEGYKEDSYRILGQGLQEAAGVVRERKPVEVIIREGGPLILGGTPPKEVEAGAGEGLIARLKQRGWVTEQ